MKNKRGEPMLFRSELAKFVGKGSLWFLKKFTKGGSSLPGKLALKIDPEILTHLSQNYTLVVITGTNGKTLTTALATAAMSDHCPNVISNPTGSNMQQGIVSTFLTSPKIKTGQKGIALLEIDEGSLKNITTHVQPDYFVFTNVFRDQLDRFGETHTIYQLLKDAALAAPDATLILNGDLPIFNDPSLSNPKVFYGFNHQKDQDVEAHYNTDGLLCPQCDHLLKYKSITYANLGKYYCPHCGFKRPQLSYQVNQINKLTLDSTKFAINDTIFDLPVAGLYNIYNALAAYSLLKELGLSDQAIQNSFKKTKRVFGRQEKIKIANKTVLLNLVKNPVGLNQVLDILSLDKKPFTLACLLNNDYADGVDVSWIWDANWEKALNFPIEEIYTGGSRKDDMTQRLVVAGFRENIIQSIESNDELIEKITNAPTDHVHILTTYTAMLQLRQNLVEHGYLK